MKVVTVLCLILIISGCGMSNEEVIKESKICTDAGFKVVQFINGFTNRTSHIRCDAVKSNNSKGE